MAERFTQLANKHIEFIHGQHLYFVGTAGSEGFVNVSPKGMDSFRIINERKVVWLNLTGSGNESAAHVLENGRMTILFCSFEKHPLILRLYGNARVIHQRDPEWEALAALFPANVGARQVFELDISLVQSSCGYAVPYYEYLGDRPTLSMWADNRGREAVEQYWKDKNVESLDGKETGILEG
jgi:hypothetical protein